MALRHGVELDAAVFRTGHLQQRERLPVYDERVRVVVHNDNVMLSCKLHKPLVGSRLRVASRRHVRIVSPHEFHVREVERLYLLPVGLPCVVFAEVVVHNPLPEYFRERGVGGVSRVRDKHAVARVAEGERDVQDALLRPDERLYLALRVEADAIPASVEIRHRVAQLRRAASRLVAVCGRVVCHLAQTLYSLWRGRHVRRADGKRYDILAFCVHAGYLL